MNLGTSYGVTTSTRDQISPSSGSGVTQEYTTTESFRTSIESSVEIGANFFEVISASVSISFGYEESMSYASTVKLDPTGRCEPNQRGILYMYPHFDEYLGYFTDNPDEEVEWFVPVAPPINYRVEMECLG